LSCAFFRAKNGKGVFVFIPCRSFIYFSLNLMILPLTRELSGPEPFERQTRVQAGF
jgi:hypothetical protein